MTPEAAAYLERARDNLNKATRIAAIGLPKPAARFAYYAALRAAQALIIDRRGRTAKAHPEVRSEFARLSREIPGIGDALPVFLAKAYKYKEIGDYAVGGGADVTMADAREMVMDAARFVDCIATLLD